jgi:hypothetical protein
MKKFSRVLACLMSISAAGAVHAQYAKLDGPLSDLVDSLRGRGRVQGSAEVPDMQSNVTSAALTDELGRVLVDVYLDGSTPMRNAVATLQSHGATITGTNPYFRFGAISAYVPTSSLTSIAGMAGLNVMKLALMPQRNVGVTTSQGATVMRSTAVNASGTTGSGITVGVLSDSYDGSPTTFTSVRAANDIASGDLVAPKFVIDYASTSSTDEGRAMMQIVHDVAPGADLCFATAFAGEASFAANIRALRTNPACNADVIVDDVFYYDEPYFSDGQVAQAVNDVATSTTLAGKKVSYFSSAGNQGQASGYGSINVPVATFSTTPTGLATGGVAINLASAATCTGSPSTGSTKADVGGGWLDFGGGTYVLPVTKATGTSTMVMQWDDPFFSGGVTTDLNWYLFSNTTGNCVFTYATNNLTADHGYEFISLTGSGSFRLMVARTSAGSKQASRVRLLNFGGWSGTALSTRSSPTTFGHSAAANANSVAAYRYTSPATQVSPFIPAIETYTSPGPVTIAFDAAGNRLAVAETRKKPDIAAPDGGNTTFFYPGSDYESDGFPNFFGTSAAAPHAAGVAALMLQTAGGPGSLTPKQVKSVLQTTTPARVIPYSGAPATTGWSLFDGFGLIDAVNAVAKVTP